MVLDWNPEFCRFNIIDGYLMNAEYKGSSIREVNDSMAYCISDKSQSRLR